jgi:hypothetical protein
MILIHPCTIVLASRSDSGFFLDACWAECWDGRSDQTDGGDRPTESRGIWEIPIELPFPGGEVVLDLRISDRVLPIEVTIPAAFIQQDGQL